MQKHHRVKIQGQFTYQLIEMKRSPPWRALSLSARRILDRIEIELAQHGGKDNGDLPVTYEHFEEYGIDRHCIAPAIREAEALGFLEVTQHGSAGNADHRRPNRFRLTYHWTQRHEPTHEWRRIGVDQAKQRARTARLAASPRRSPGRKANLQCGKPTPVPMGILRIEDLQTPVGIIPTTAPEESPTTSISGGGGGVDHARSAPAG